MQRDVKANVSRGLGVLLCLRRRYAALLHQAHLLFLLGRGLLFDRAADDPLLQVQPAQQ